MSVAVDAAARRTHADPAAKADQYLSNLNSLFRVATGWNFRSSPRVGTTMERIKMRFPKQIRVRRGQADLKKIFQHIAGWLFEIFGEDNWGKKCRRAAAHLDAGVGTDDRGYCRIS